MASDTVSATRPTFRLNGEQVSIPAGSNGTTLLEFIRSRGLTGAKEGCAEGECGACTVALVAARGNRSEYRPMNSCLVLLPTVADREICTVEALASGDILSDCQEALAAAGGSQCGYCTPGFVVSLFAEQYRPGRSGPCDVAALSGNLCRCTGYRPIADAARALGAPPRGALLDRLSEPASRISHYQDDGVARPVSLESALHLLRERPDATIVSGATDVGVDLNLKGRRAGFMLAVDAVPELQRFEHGPEAVAIGAALPLTDIGRLWTDAPAAVHEWLELFASPLIRNRATLGGNLVTASPIGDAAPLLLALDARVALMNTGGTRSVPLAEFFTGYRRTVRAADELVVSIDVPLPLPQHVRFYKVSKRRLDDISTVAAGMSLTLDDGRVSRARFAFGGVAATPIRVTAAEQAVTGHPWDEAACDTVRTVIEASLDPLTDQRGSKEYRRAVAASLVEKFWWEVRGNS